MPGSGFTKGHLCNGFAFLLLVTSFACSQSPSPNTNLEPSGQPVVVAEVEDELYHRINQVRQAHGKAPLSDSEELAQVAREYSNTMADKNFLSHQGPLGEDATERVGQAGLQFKALGENLFLVRNATSQGKVVDTAVQGWLESPGHFRNILRGFDQTGIGVYRHQNDYYITQLFRKN